jgi:DNA-binding XRE family transcriptional regulator
VENPIRAARHKSGKTGAEFAQDIGIHPQALYLNEMGMYSHILPKVLTYLMRTFEHSRDYLEADYAQFVEQQRRAFGRLYGLSGFSLGDLGAPGGTHPVVQFRAHIGIAQGHPRGLSRMGFAKSFCIHSAELYSLENGEKHGLSEQFKLAMTTAGLPAIVLAELEGRCDEFANGEWSSEPDGDELLQRAD